MVQYTTELFRFVFMRTSKIIILTVLATSWAVRQYVAFRIRKAQFITAKVVQQNKRIRRYDERAIGYTRINNSKVCGMFDS